MKRGDKGKLFSLFVPLFFLSPYSARLCAPCGCISTTKVTYTSAITGKNNGFPILDILGYLKNTHKNPKFGRVRKNPILELGWEFPY